MSSEENKEIALGVSRAIMNGNWEKLDALLSPEFSYSGDGRKLNKEQYVGFMRGLHTAMSEMNMEFHDVLAEGNKVVVRFTNTVKHTGEFFGISGTGKTLKVGGQFIRQVKGGQVVEEWQTTDLLGMMKQMGVIPDQQ